MISNFKNLNYYMPTVLSEVSKEQDKLVKLSQDNKKHVYSNNNRSKKKHQALKSIRVTKRSLDDLSAQVNTLTPSCLRVLELLIILQDKHKRVHPTQTTLANMAGVTRKTVSRALATLEEKGFVSSTYRHMTSCYYTISSLFFNCWVRIHLKHVIRYFKSAGLLALLVVPFHFFSKENNYQREYASQFNKLVIKNIITNYIGGNEDEKMQQFSRHWTEKDPVSSKVRNLKFLNLTKRGQIFLSAFPDEAIEYALKRFDAATEVRDPLGYIGAACRDYCGLNSLLPDWAYVVAVSAHFRIASDASVQLTTKQALNTDGEAQPAYNMPLKPQKRIDIPTKSVEKTTSSVNMHRYPVYQSKIRPELDRATEHNKFEQAKKDGLAEALKFLGLDPNFNPFAIKGE